MAVVKDVTESRRIPVVKLKAIRNSIEVGNQLARIFLSLDIREILQFCVHWFHCLFE